MRNRTISTTAALELLKLGAAPTPEEIKKAYYAASKIAHPDSGGTEEAMIKINEAYEVLSDARFDKQVSRKEDMEQSKELAEGILALLKTAMNESLFINYFAEIFGLTFESKTKFEAKLGYRCYNATFVASFASEDGETVLRFRGWVDTAEIMYKTASVSQGVGISGIPEFPITLDIDMLHNNKKVKPYQRNYRLSESSNLVFSPSDLFPEDVMKRALKNSKKRKFSKQDMIGALRAKFGATFDGEYLTILIGEGHRIVFYRSVFQRQAGWGCNGFYRSRPHEKILQGIMSLPENEETLLIMERAIVAMQEASEAELLDVVKTQLTHLRNHQSESSER